jgi:hypothetical protein
MSRSVVEQVFARQGLWFSPLELASVVRYRCTACGNLTRFDVTTSRRSRAFHHYTVGGELTIEDEEVLAESVDEVTCRWCGTGTAVEVTES